MKQDLVHGGALDRMRAAFPEASEPWIDLSTGINPWAYPHTDVPETALRHLPTHTAYDACRSAMAASTGAPEDSLLLAPGSELLIRLLPTIIAPERVAILSPTYGDHARVWRAAGCDLIETPDPLAAADRADAIVLCQPNNPDGRRFDTARLLETAAQLAARGGWLIVDEAYADLDRGLSLARYGGTEGLVILRSFGKFFGLAGLRLGALMGPESLREALQARLGVWSVAGPALHIGARAYGDLDWQDGTRARLAEARRRLDETLARAGLSIIGGTDLFCLVETEDATALWQRLARAGIYVRRFDWSEKLIRIGLPESDAAEARLADALSP
ncbi:threonine-phosphate decarboxylase CobD [Henriciella aquimarina]|uniref:threonine-phosphate decarboxylase CobD n=1 Tax=Henriciella aquimarina TaxID=545261 RepID=UPI0009FD7FFB|nr:threonine-phosphate decarboxylase CobD [Henriciella aquimarina]